MGCFFENFQKRSASLETHPKLLGNPFKPIKTHATHLPHTKMFTVSSVFRQAHTYTSQTQCQCADPTPNNSFQIPVNKRLIFLQMNKNGSGTFPHYIFTPQGHAWHFRLFRMLSVRQLPFNIFGLIADPWQKFRNATKSKILWYILTILTSFIFLCLFALQEFFETADATITSNTRPITFMLTFYLFAIVYLLVYVVWLRSAVYYFPFILSFYVVNMLVCL